jgi:DNA-binding CsgD family transcriptional regulator
MGSILSIRQILPILSNTERLGTLAIPCIPSQVGAVTRHVILYGLAGGVLIALLRVIEYRWLVVEHSVEIYGGLIAAIFAGLGIWLGLRVTRGRERVVVRNVVHEVVHEVVREVPVPTPPTIPFVRDDARIAALGVTPRELEILELIAAGLSTREIAARIFVSENTVKTHASRLFDKLGARRRTQAVQIGQRLGLIP